MLSLLIGALFSKVYASPFITTWKVKEDKELCFKLKGNATISWYKKGNPSIKGKDVLDKNSCLSLPDTGVYVIEIENLTGFRSTKSHASQLISIDQWGATQWEELDSAFAGCENMQGLAKDIPDLTKVSSLAYMFRSAESFN